MEHRGRDPYFVNSVAHAGDVLRAFDSPDEVLSLRDVISRSALSKGIAFRILYTLEKIGLVEKVGMNQYRCAVHQAQRRKYKVGYAAQGTIYQFSQEVTASLKREADRLETVELLVLDNKYNPKTALKNAELFIKEQCDIIIEFQTDETVAPIISAKYCEAKIPLIAMEIPHPGGVYFGANNYAAGLIGGRSLGRWARDNWAGQLDEIVMFELPRAGNVPRARLTGTLTGIREVLPGVENCPVTYLDGDGRFDESLKATRKHLRTVTPRRTLVSGINDASVLGALRAYEEAGREKQCAFMGQNAAPEAREELRRPSRFIGSVAYFPERYGEQVLKLALDILGHRATPPAVFVRHQLITAQNVDSIYMADRV